MPNRVSAELLQMVNAYRISQAIHAAVALHIPDLIADATRSSDDLALQAGADPDALYRLLRALAALGILHEENDRRFSLTDFGQPLRSDAPESIAAWAAYVGRPYFWSAWGNLVGSVRTGRTAIELEHGTDVWAYREQRPDEGVIFDAAMTALARLGADAIVRAYDFTPFGCIVDVGGGRGANLANILQAAPNAHGILLDQPHVVADAPETLRAAGVADRCQIVGGSFFDPAPPGGDAYVLRHVLHDWPDDACIRILAGVRAGMPAHARILVLDRVIGPPNMDAPNKISDLNMLVSPGGRERTAEQFASLFTRAGLHLQQIVATGEPDSVIEAILAE